MTEPLSPEYLAEIAARAEAATAGPWGFYDGDNYADVAADLKMTGRGSYSCRQQVARLEDESYWDDPAHEDDDEERAPEQMAADAAFIAAARTDVPALLAEVGRLRAESTANPVPTERSRWQAVADALNEIDIAGIDLDGTIAGHNAWSVVRGRDAGWMVSGPAAEAGESR